MRVLSNEDVEAVLTVDECLKALEQAYKDYTLGQAANRARTHTYFPVEDECHPGFRYRFKSQEGGSVSSGVWALRITSDIVGVETLANGVQRRRLLPAAPGNRYVGLVTLYSMKTLEPLAIMHDSFIQKMRVGATSALGIDAVAPAAPRVAGMFGSGWQAQAHLQMLLHVRADLEEIRVYSPTPEHREHFAREQTARWDRPVIAVGHPREAVEGCQIVTAATAAMDPCFDGAWLEPGAHVTAITSPDGTATRRELDDATFDRASLLMVTSREQIHHDKQFDILGPVERGHMAFEDIRDIGEVLLGQGDGRRAEGDVTVFANNTGMGLQFAAVCARVLELAEERDLGHTIPTDWFLEETTP